MRTRLDEPFIFSTRAWVERVVIGLNLCPFAQAPALKGTIRYALSEAETAEALLEDLATELRRLVGSPPEELETTLLVHPRVLQNFNDCNDFLEFADEVLQMMALEGEIQIASFHPQYQFAGAKANDIGNSTNRSPYPTLHLLREASITRAIDAFGDTRSISADNLARQRLLGPEGLAAVARQTHAV